MLVFYYLVAYPIDTVMVDRQKQKILPPHLIIASLVLVFGILIGGLFVLFNTSPAAAKEGCPGQETPGTGVNAGKCIGLDGKPTTNTPSADPAAPAAPTGEQAKATDETTEDDTETCAIEKMGWILCPVIETSGKIGDKAFSLLANNFLQTEPELVSQDSGTKTAWGLARNLANLMFIIVFIIIILSQVTGRGINNYGIKKLLPRLVIGAILVNVSYYVCQLMVDLSNILGFELKNFLVDTARTVTSSAVFPTEGLTGTKTSGGALGLIAGGILGIAAIVWFLLPVLFLGVSTVVITCLVVIAILLMRKALIILLVVLSPIAFVAYLLPNTEGYFQKWIRMFWQLLMVFPIVGMLFGAGQLASAVILVSGTHSNDGSYKDTGGKCIQLPKSNGTGEDARIGKCTTGSTPFMLGLVAAGVAVAPMLAVWAVLKGALSAAGAIGGKIAGAVEGGTRKGADWGSKNTAIGRGMAARKAIRQNYKDQKFAEKMSGTDWKRGGYTRLASRGVMGNAGALAKIASNKLDQHGGKFGDVAAKSVNFATGSLQAQDSKLSSNFAGAAAKIFDQEIKDKEAVLAEQTHQDDNKTAVNKLTTELTKAIINGDTAGVKAATNMLMARGSSGTAAIRGAFESGIGTGSGAGDVAFRNHLAGSFAGLKASDADIWSSATGESISNITAGLTDAQVGSQSTAAMNKMLQAIDSDRAARIVQNKDVVKDMKGDVYTALKNKSGI